MEDPESLLNRAHRQRGPLFGRGPGRPWNGIVERTPVLWVTWIVDAARRAEISPNELKVSFYGVAVKWNSAELTFGTRWYFLCPRCGRRCEAVYFAGAVGCRVCLHLGYLSQSRRPTSAWLWLDRLFTRTWPFSRRYSPTDEAGAIVKELGKEFRKQVRDLVDQIDIVATQASDASTREDE